METALHRAALRVFGTQKRSSRIYDVQLLRQNEEEFCSKLASQKPAATDERLINSHRKQGGIGKRETRVNERKREETRGEFRIYSAYDLWRAISARAIRYNINNYHRSGRNRRPTCRMIRCRYKMRPAEWLPFRNIARSWIVAKYSIHT